MSVFAATGMIGMLAVGLFSDYEAWFKSAFVESWSVRCEVLFVWRSCLGRSLFKSARPSRKSIFDAVCLKFWLLPDNRLARVVLFGVLLF